MQTLTEMLQESFGYHLLNESLNDSVLHEVKSNAYINEATEQLINNKKPNPAKSLIVSIDLEQLESGTLDNLWNDYHVDWSKLNDTKLYRLWKYVLNVRELTFEEWCEENNFRPSGYVYKIRK